jgi:hypothetical protein
VRTESGGKHLFWRKELPVEHRGPLAGLCAVFVRNDVSLTLPRAKRISGFKKEFVREPKGFFNTISTSVE